jgi:NADH:ubiquinone oxidoreductase subunit F (NADH-binding)
LYNTALSSYSTIAGGNRNKATQAYAVVSGGLYNTAANYAVASGGKNHKALGQNAAITGGRWNTVSGADSVAIGSYGTAEDSNAAVLSFNTNTAGCTSNSCSARCTSQGEGTVNICADNGLFVNGEDLMERLSAMEDLIANLTARCS